MADIADLTDLEVFARTLYGEARGETPSGKEAVACVIMNRVNADLGDDDKPDWWGEGVRDVCLKPWQFSCWNKNDPNRVVLLSLDDDDPTFLECIAIASQARAGELNDPTHGAVNYKRVGTPAPWAEGRTPVITIGHHEFYTA